MERRRRLLKPSDVSRMGNVQRSGAPGQERSISWLTESDFFGLVLVWDIFPYVTKLGGNVCLFNDHAPLIPVERAFNPTLNAKDPDDHTGISGKDQGSVS